MRRRVLARRSAAEQQRKQRDVIMRDLKIDELGAVYGAGGRGKKHCAPKKHKGGSSRKKGRSSSKGRKHGKSSS
jgi:hypothetical protein